MHTGVQSSLVRYGVAVGSVVLALALSPLLECLDSATFMAFLAAVTVSTWYGGTGPGLVATGLSLCTLDFFVLPPVLSLSTGRVDAIRLGVLGLLALLISLLPLTGAWLASERRWLAQGKDLAFAVLAHEVRGPLAAISNAVSVLRLGVTNEQTVKWASDMVDRQTRSIAKQVESLLDVSRLAQGKVPLRVKQVNLSTIVQHAAETTLPLIEARGHTLDVLLPPKDLYVEADPDRIEQVLVNLLTNAAKYTPPSGCICVRLERRHSQAVLRVPDSGIGIPTAFLPHVFDLYSQERNGSQSGLGIGLYLARGLVRLHGGTITARSEGPGKGSEFVVRLPLLSGPTHSRPVAYSDPGGSCS
jgi:signal transduction histidine kinase